MNQIKTIFLMGALAALIVFLAQMLGGPQYAYFAFGFALLINFFSYWFSDKIVLRMYGAKEISAQDNPRIHQIVEELCSRGNLPKPKIYLIDDATPNAFATGRNPKHSAVAVTSGILSLLNEQQLSGVLGHELTHIKNKDILIATIASVMAMVVMYLADIIRWSAFFGGSKNDDEDRGSNILIVILVPIVAYFGAMLIQMAISRSREYLADADGAKLSNNPSFLASALGKLEDGVANTPLQHGSTATASLFIVNPFRGDKIAKLFSTHPPIEDRIRRLEEMNV